MVDLPGIYSLGASSPDERVAAEYLLGERPDLSVVVSGPNVYKVTASKTVTLLGTIDAGTTPASMASNGTNSNHQPPS